MKIDLGGTWTLASLGEKKVNVKAAVPGDTHHALLQAGVIKDPYWAMDELDMQWVGRTDWSFSRTFTADATLLAKKAVVLVCEKIDTVAEVFVNGQSAGTSENMHVRFVADIKPLLKQGENTIEVRIKSGVNVAARAAEKYPLKLFHQQWVPVYEPNWTQLRKTACHSGWDWGVCMVVAGLYDGVYLQGVDEARIEYVYTDQKHEKGACELTVHAELFAPVACETSLDVTVGKETVSARVKLQAGTNTVSAKLKIKNPELWYPAGYGKQPLYDLTVRAGGDTFTRKLGLRKMEVNYEEDKVGRAFVVRVNDVNIFCKGADWIPCDGFPSRQTPAVMDDLLESAIAANMNMLRIWGGGQYECDYFYAKCDELGMLLWHDFMFACGEYPAGDRKWLASVKFEAEHQVKRLRDYASIALWCGDNEVIGSVHWGKTEADKFQRLMHFDRINFGVLGEVTGRLDPDRLFWPSSPCAGPNELTDTFKESGRGDMHFWQVWHGSGSFELYYDITPRFCSEFGFQSLPSLETIASYAPKDQWNITAPVFDHHQRNPRGNSIITEMFTRYFRVPEGFEFFAYLSQVQQALAIKTGVEYWRTLRPVCMGTLYWQLNDNWPVCSWSSLDYGGKWKLLHHAARRFYAPLMCTAFRKNPDVVEVWAVNDHLSPRKVEMTLTVHGFDGSKKKTEVIKAEVAAESSLELFKKPVAELTDDRTATFVTVSMKSEDGVYENVLFLDKPKACTLPETKVEFKVGEDKDGLFVTLTADKPAFYVSVETMGVGGEFDDNMITLLPGSPRTLRLKPRTAAGKSVTKQDLEKAITVRHLRATYK